MTRAIDRIDRARTAHIYMMATHAPCGERLRRGCEKLQSCNDREAHRQTGGDRPAFGRGAGSRLKGCGRVRVRPAGMRLGRGVSPQAVLLAVVGVWTRVCVWSTCALRSALPCARPASHSSSRHDRIQTHVLSSRRAGRGSLTPVVLLPLLLLIVGWLLRRSGWLCCLCDWDCGVRVELSLVIAINPINPEAGANDSHPTRHAPPF